MSRAAAASTTPTDVVPASTHRHSRVQLFRFSAATWNSHRIHYDVELARDEGHPDVVVQSTLHGEVLVQRTVAAFGPGTEVVAVEWRNEVVAVADQDLRFAGEVVGREPDPDVPGRERIEVACRITTPDGAVAVRGRVVVRPAGDGVR